jgi:hypothetical protein
MKQGVNKISIIQEKFLFISPGLLNLKFEVAGIFDKSLFLDQIRNIHHGDDSRAKSQYKGDQESYGDPDSNAESGSPHQGRLDGFGFIAHHFHKQIQPKPIGIINRIVLL